MIFEFDCDLTGQQTRIYNNRYLSIYIDINR